MSDNAFKAVPGLGIAANTETPNTSLSDRFFLFLKLLPRVASPEQECILPELGCGRQLPKKFRSLRLHRIAPPPVQEDRSFPLHNTFKIDLAVKISETIGLFGHIMPLT